MFGLSIMRIGLASAALALAASAANATTINFNVDRGLTAGSNSYSSTDGSISVDVDGVQVDDNGTIVNTSDFSTYSRNGEYGGIGVRDCMSRSDRANPCMGENRLIDGFGPDEFALLDFGDATVQVTSATFHYWNWHDTFAYGVYENTVLPASADIYRANVSDSDFTPYTHMFGDGELVGSIIGFGADSFNDSFILQSITFEVVSAVPLPAGMLLVLTGLGGLGLMRRRKKIA